MVAISASISDGKVVAQSLQTAARSPFSSGGSHTIGVCLQGILLNELFNFLCEFLKKVFHIGCFGPDFYIVAR